MPRLAEIPDPERTLPDGARVWTVTCDGLPPDNDCPTVLGTVTYEANERPQMSGFNGYLCDACVAQRDAQQQDE